MIVAPTQTFLIAVFTIPVAAVGTYLVNCGIGFDRVPKAAILTVVLGLFGLPLVVGIAVKVF